MKRLLYIRLFIKKKRLTSNETRYSISYVLSLYLLSIQFINRVNKEMATLTQTADLVNFVLGFSLVD